MLTVGAIRKIRVLCFEIYYFDWSSSSSSRRNRMTDPTWIWWHLFLCKEFALFSMQICPIIARIRNCQVCPVNIVSSLQLNLLVRHLGSNFTSSLSGKAVCLAHVFQITFLIWSPIQLKIPWPSGRARRNRGTSDANVCMAGSWMSWVLIWRSFQLEQCSPP